MHAKKIRLRSTRPHRQTGRVATALADTERLHGRRAVTRLQKARPSLSEQEIHRTVVKHLQLRGASGLVFLHPPNGGYRRRTEAAIFKGLGVRPGASYLLLFHDGKFFALELKKPGGCPSEDQLRFLSDFEKAGGYTAVTDDLNRALATLKACGLLRGTVA
jgi:hypothetical protein